MKPSSALATAPARAASPARARRAALTLVLIGAAACHTAWADGPASAAANPPCAIGSVTGVGGATASRERFRYLTDHPIQCEVSDDERASRCTGITTLRHERVSVYDDSDSATTLVVAHIELEHGTYPGIIAVPKSDLTCDRQ